MRPCEIDDLGARLFVKAVARETSQDKLPFGVECDDAIGVAKPNERGVRITSSRRECILVVPKLLTGREVKASDAVLLVKEIDESVTVERLRHKSAQIFFVFPSKGGIGSLRTELDGL